MTGHAPLKVSMVNRPYPGEESSGDWPFCFTRDQDVVLGLVDSLGHGVSAHAGSMRIKDFLEKHWSPDLPRLLDDLHKAISGGLGAAICVAHVDLGSGALRCLGIGNVRASLLGATNQSFVSRDGVLGQYYSTPTVQQAVLVRGDKLVFASDGLHERLFTQCQSSEFAARSPESLAQYLLRHFGKMHDDASCLVFEF